MLEIKTNYSSRILKSIDEKAEEKIIVLFDNECLLCNTLIHFIIQRSKDIFFAPLSSSKNKIVHKENNFDTIIFIENKKEYTKSTAVLRIIRRMNGLWPLLYFMIVIPGFIRNGIYDLIAKNRYIWFGKTTYCNVSYPRNNEQISE